MPGHKTWAIGEEVLAADFGPYVSDQIVAVYGSAAARASGWPSPPNGAVSQLLDSPGSLWFYNGTAWVQRSAPAFCTSSTRPTGAALYPGLKIYETDTQREYVYDGANWQPAGSTTRSYTVLGDIGPLAANGPISFTAIPSTYTHLRLVAALRANSGSTTDSAFCRINSDAGANYFDGDVHNYANVVGAGGGGRTGAFNLGVCSGATGVRPSAHVAEFMDYAYNPGGATSFGQKVGTVQYFAAEGGQAFTGSGGWLWLSQAAITQLDLLCAGNGSPLWLQGSRATLLGIR